MIELKEYNGYKNSVFINGELLKYQMCEDPVVTKDYLIVKCFTDQKLSGCPKEEYWNNLPYQITKRVIVSPPDGVQYSIFHFDTSKIKKK